MGDNNDVKFTMKYLLPIFLLSIGSLGSYAQQDNLVKKYKITGRVTDSLSKQPIEYATINVFPEGSTKPIDGASTDKTGFFSIGGLAGGKYKIVFGFIGYITKTKTNILLEANQPTVDLGNTVLQNGVQSLENVTVTAKKSLVENRIDKLVYNAEKDITSQGGVATDILRKVPMISVDVNGNVELQGSTNIQVLINGKPSTIFGTNLADALQAIPSSQIKSIEVITSPGARYDAEGTGGIINIILKDNKSKGVNGTVTLSTGTRLENGSADLTVRNGSFGMNASLSGNAQIKGTTLNSLDRSSTDSNNNSSRLIQDGQSSLSRNNYKALTGFDWSVTKQDVITGSISYNHYEVNTDGYVGQNQTFHIVSPSPARDSIVNTLRNVSSPFLFHSVDSYLDYKKKFRKEGEEFAISVQSSVGRSNSSYDQIQQYTTNGKLFAGARGSNAVSNKETILQSDYTLPLQNESKLELGAKATLSRVTGNAEFYGFNPVSSNYKFDSSQVNNFTYDRNVYAIYSTVTFKLFSNYDVKLGGRFERTTINADFSAGKTVIPSYNFFMPTATISRTFENKQTIKLSYSRRIQRPGYRSLNPFLDASDPTNISTGNPGLVPELVHYGEFVYSKSFDNGGSLVASLYSRYSTEDLQGYIYYYPTLKVGDSLYHNVAVNTTENVGIQNVAGLNIYGNAPINAKLTLRGSLVFYDLYIKNLLLPNNTANSINYRTNLSATYQFTDDLIGEFFGNFRSPSREIQGSSTTFITYSFAFKKMIWKKKGSIGFTTTNPFNRYVDLQSNLTGQNFNLIGHRKIPFQSFGISFFYKFGKLEFQKPKADDNPENN